MSPVMCADCQHARHVHATEDSDWEGCRVLGCGCTGWTTRATEWTVTKALDRIRAGDRIVFEERWGGEGETVTATGGANNLMGTWTLGVEELDHDLEFNGNVHVRLAP